MDLKKIIVLILACSFILTAAVACQREGTAEKAGKEIDKAFNTAKDKLNEATK